LSGKTFRRDSIKAFKTRLPYFDGSRDAPATANAPALRNVSIAFIKDQELLPGSDRSDLGNA
jgi:hypothetical protein